MQTYIYYVAEKVPGALEMQRFAHPIHVGLVTAEKIKEGIRFAGPRAEMEIRDPDCTVIVTIGCG